MILKVISANSVDHDQSDLGPHCLPVCKNRFEKFARIFSRQHKQKTFSGAVFLGHLRVKDISRSHILQIQIRAGTVNVQKFKCYSILLAQIVLFIQLFLKIFSGMANGVDSDQTAPSAV